MCRNIKILFNFSPPVTEEEIRAASLQFVRKVSGFNKPSKTNEAAFLAAVEGITAISSNLLSSLETNAPPRYREVEAAKGRPLKPVNVLLSGSQGSKMPPNLPLNPDAPRRRLRAVRSRPVNLVR